MDDRLKKQLDFIVEIDKIKAIIRKSKLFDGSRLENDAEHSWHLAMMAILLSEYANAPIDLLKTIKMVLIHDIVEIDAGDIIVYQKDPSKTDEKEAAAANRIFGLLPDDQRSELLELWREFEEKRTPEANFAGAIDRLEPVMQNYFTDAYAWREHHITAARVLETNRGKIGAGSAKLWEYAESIINECIKKGLIG
jgi:putative hydrolase of HD superfamily